jgi:TolB protein
MSGLAPARFAAAALLASFAGTWWAQPADAAFPGANGKLAIYGLETLKIDGSTHRDLTPEGEEPAWSPDGARIVYRVSGGTLWLVNGNGRNAHSLGVTGYGPDWSPDGTKIVFFQNDGINVVNADGTGLTKLTDDLDREPAWSPDGTKIVFHRFHDTPLGPLPALWIMDANGDNEHLLYDDADGVGYGPMMADWSPDGTKIVFTTHQFAQVYVMDADGSDPTQLTSDGYNFLPVFSPDGTKIAFTSSRDRGIWTMNANGTQQVRRNTVDVPDYRLAWQPLHVTLAVSTNRAGYKDPVTITTRLLEDVTTTGTVSIYTIPYGEPSSLLVSGPVDGNGKLVTVVHPAARTSFYATWTGDATHPAGGVTDPVTVRVIPRLRGALTHFDSRAGGYRLYDYTASCPGQGHGCPTFAVSLTPSHAGQKLRFELDLFYRGHWLDALRYRRQLPGNGKLAEIFVYGNASIVGLPTRVRASFGGDSDHLPVRTAWAYFKVV